MLLMILAAAAALATETPAPAGAEQRVTFGMQCRFDDGRKISLVATRRDDRFMLARQVEGGNLMVYMTVDGHGGTTFEGEDDPATLTAWRDAYGDLKKLPLETIKADEIAAFVAKKDVPRCGHKTFFWRGG